MNFDNALEAFCTELQRRHAADYAENYPNLTAPVFMTETGRRYVRVVRVETSGCGRSAHCFVDRTNGNVLKAAGWKAPAKHARGNVFTGDFGLTTRGSVAYLR